MKPNVEIELRVKDRDNDKVYALGFRRDEVTNPDLRVGMLDAAFGHLVNSAKATLAKIDLDWESEK